MKKDKEIVRDMFDSIAWKYDFLNHTLSLGIDKCWRRKVTKIVLKQNPKSVLDVATGTGDLAITIASKAPNLDIMAVDMSTGMLEIAKQKVEKLGYKNISLEEQDGLNMSFEDNEFDVVTISFGVRNFENLDKGLLELTRVVRSGGKVVIMEVSTPSGIVAKPYMFYFGRVLPFIGRVFSKNNTAYTYLHDSVVSFPSGDDFVSIMSRNGLSDITFERLTFGVATIYVGTKL